MVARKSTFGQRHFSIMLIFMIVSKLLNNIRSKSTLIARLNLRGFFSQNPLMVKNVAAVSNKPQSRTTSKLPTLYAK